MSTHYISDDKIKGLLTKISNQIIKRWRAKIDIWDMLEGDTDKCMQDLDESINCCNEWKRIWTRAQQMIFKYGGKSNGRQWNLSSDDTIFAENEAFIQRCKDLKDIWEGQLQFARKGQGITLPRFGGSKDPEIKKNLEELQTMFQKYLKNIKNLDYDILDVKKTNWHDDYGQKFKENQKSLEAMNRNTVLHAFKKYHNHSWSNWDAWELPSACQTSTCQRIYWNKGSRICIHALHGWDERSWRDVWKSCEENQASNASFSSKIFRICNMGTLSS